MSDKYTPDTESVRWAYVARKVSIGICPFTAEDNFNRWLRTVQAEAWEEGSLARADKGLGLADNPYKAAT